MKKYLLVKNGCAFGITESESYTHNDNVSYGKYIKETNGFLHKIGEAILKNYNKTNINKYSDDYIDYLPTFDIGYL